MEVRHANENLVTKWCFLSQKGRKWGGKWAIENFLKIFRGIILSNGDFISKFVSLWQKCNLKVEFPPLYKSFL